MFYHVKIACYQLDDNMSLIHKIIYLLMQIKA